MNINKIAIIHPSRGRPDQSFEIERLTRETSSNKIPIKYILSLDIDDITVGDYRKNFDTTDIIITVNDNKGYVDACNNAAKLITDEALIFVLSDDFYTPHDWDLLLRDSILKIPTEEYLLNVSDKYSNRNDCAVITIISTKLYNRLGWVYCPEYITGWCDNDILEVAKTLGVLYTDFSIVIEHKHPDWLPNIPRDATYLKTADPTKVAHSAVLFNKRKANNFGF